MIMSKRPKLRHSLCSIPTWLYSSSILCALLFLALPTAWAQTGPGGVGSSSTHVLYLRADTGRTSPVSNGDALSTLDDLSGNDNDASAANGEEPIFRDNLTDNIQGRPVLDFSTGADRFDFVDDATLNTGGAPYDEEEIIVVFRTGGDVESFQTLYEEGGTTTGISIYLEDNNSSTDGNGRIYFQTYGGGNIDGLVSGGPILPNTEYIARLRFDANAGEVEGFLNERSLGVDNSGVGSLGNHGGSVSLGQAGDGTLDSSGSSVSASTTAFEGQIAELLAYNDQVFNDAEAFAVRTYLQARYGINQGVSSYDFATNHPNEVVTLGESANNNTLTAARGLGLIEISTSATLNAGTYLHMGADNGDADAWTTAELDPRQFNSRRLEREWRIDDDNNLGNVTFTIDANDLPAAPNASFTDYYLLVDRDGDFNSIDARYAMTNTSGSSYAATYNPQDGDYVTIAIVEPSLRFAGNPFRITEGTGGTNTQTLTAQLNVTDALTVDYATASTGANPATAGTDYTTISTTQLSFSAGTGGSFSDQTLTVDIDEDNTAEPSETFALQWSNPSQTLSTEDADITILDDDNTKTVAFSAATSSANEDVSGGSVNIGVSVTGSGTQSVDVDYAVTGGSATGSGTDYTRASGTLNLGTNSSGNINVSLTGDNTFEPDETIELTLRNPSGANLGSPDVHTLTITNDDPVPDLLFDPVADTASEDAGAQTVNVVLTNPSYQTITVDINNLDGAAQEPADYSFLGNTLQFNPGVTSQPVTVTLASDNLIESRENFRLQLSNANNAGIQTSDLSFFIEDPDTIGFVGPGGVGRGNDEELVFWLQADAITGLNPGQDLSSNHPFPDLSANGFDADRVSTAGYNLPSFQDSVINNRAVVRFDASQTEALNIPDQSAININGSSYDAKAAFFVFRTGSNVSNRQVIYEQGGGSRGFNFYIRNGSLYYGVYGTGSAYISTSIQPNTTYIASQQYSSANGGSLTAYLDGAQVGVDNGITLLSSHSGDIGIGGIENTTVFDNGSVSSGEHFDGDIAELIQFNLDLNDAQRIAVEQYLAGRYGINLSPDRYTHESTHSGNIIGVGQAADGTYHPVAKGRSLLRMDNPEDVAPGEFTFMGSDRASIASWDTIEVGSRNFRTRRLAREWRVDETNGDPGVIQFSIDRSELPNPPSGYTDYYILEDTDGNFNRTDTLYPLQQVGATDWFQTRFNPSDDAYLALAVMDPGIRLVPDSINVDESIGNVAIRLETNVLPTSSETIDFRTLDDVAVSGSDFTALNGTQTFSAFDRTDTVSISITDDSNPESTERFELEVLNPSITGLDILDTAAVLINDDDNDNDLSFASSSAAVSENATTVQATVNLTRNTGNTQTVTVDYAVASASTATAGEDFTSLGGTLNLGNSGNSSATIDITILEELDYELDETVLVTLTNPQNANIQGPLTFTLTINNDDSRPTATFRQTLATPGESAGAQTAEVVLSAPSYERVSVQIRDNEITALQGPDYLFLDTLLVFPPGDTTLPINYEILQDNRLETNEIFELDITSVQNGSIGADNVREVRIQDDDAIGNVGPGGVGEGNADELVYWLRAGNITGLNDGQDLSGTNVFNDLSANGLDFDNTGNNFPSYESDPTNAINGQAVVQFDSGNNENMTRSTVNAINGDGSGYDAKTMYVVFRTGSNISNQQVIYEQGGGSNGLNLYIENDTLYYGIYSSGDAYLDTAIRSNTVYIASMRYTSSNGGSLTAYLNGERIGSDNGISRLSGHGGSIGLGSIVSTTVLESGQVSSGAYFDGEVAELIQYNRNLNDAQLIVIDNYLASRYDINLGTVNRYSHAANFGNEVIGIGRAADSSSHPDARGRGVLEISGATGQQNQEFLFLGYDNGDFSNWTTTEVDPRNFNTQRLAREWRVDESGLDVGTVTFTIDGSQLPAAPSGYTDYYVLQDADGDFSSTDTLYPLCQVGATTDYEVRFNPPNDAYLALAVMDPAVRLVPDSINVDENVGTVAIRLEANVLPTSSETIDFRTVDDVAVSGSDFTALNGAQTFGAFDRNETVSISITDDSDQESTERFELEVLNPSITGLDILDTAAILIEDNDQTNILSLSSSTASTLENAASTTVSVDLNRGTSDPVTVDYAVSPSSTATQGEDFGSLTGTGTLDFGTSGGGPETFDIPVLEDIDFEQNETVVVSLTNPQNASINGPSSFTLTINDEDNPPEAAFDSLAFLPGEATGQTTLRLSLNAQSYQTIQVGVVDSAQSASFGTDYTFNDSVFTFNPGDTIVDVPYTILDDTDIESNETFALHIDTVINAGEGSPASTEVRIRDDDAIGVVGPGGVGEANSNQLIYWLRASDISGLNDGDPLSSNAGEFLPDISANTNDADGSGNNFPTFESDATSAVNGRPVVTFDGTNDELNIDNDNDINISSFPAKTMYVVFRTGSDITNRQVLYEQGGGSNGLMLWIESGSLNAFLYNGGNGPDLSTPGSGTNQIATNTAYVAAVRFSEAQDSFVLYLNGRRVEGQTALGSNLNSHGGDITLGASGGGNDFPTGPDDGPGLFFEGDLAEVVQYNLSLNQAQRTAIDNYLGARYGISIGNDQFSHQGAQGNQVFGIGRAGDGSSHPEARGETPIRLSGASNNDNGEFLFIGHDGASASAWTTSELDPRNFNTQRLAREYRLDESNGDLGDITFTVDVSTLPALPSGYSQYYLLEDADGDFTSTDTLYRLDQVGTGADYRTTFNPVDDAYLTLAIMEPSVRLVPSSVTLTEADFAQPVTVETNFMPTGNETIDYRTVDGTATAPGDYTALDAQLALSSLDRRDTLLVDIKQDATTVNNSSEGQESFTFEIDQSSPSLTVLNTTTINIDERQGDNEIRLPSTSATVNEGDGTVDFTVELDQLQANNLSISVDYQVQGGTATPGNGNDFELVGSGSLSFTGNNTTNTQTATISVDLNDDFVNEPSETIVIELLNPQNTTIASGSETFTYTVNDNDNVPEVGFVRTSESQAENAGNVVVSVNLSNPTTQTVSVDVSSSGGSATDGTDYNSVSTTLLFGAGDTVETFTYTINEDADPELDETFSLSLSNPSNAGLRAGETSQSVEIIDNDPINIGNDGPGGVGTDANDEVVIWLRPENFSGLSDGTNLSTIQPWSDATVSTDNSADEQAGNASFPSYESDAGNTINDQPVVRFDRANTEGLSITSNTSLNQSASDAKVFFMVFRTGGNVSNQQMLYEQGGSGDGVNLYIDNGNLYFGLWSSSSPSISNTFLSQSGLQTNTVYLASFRYSDADDRFEGFLDGQSVGSATVNGQLSIHNSAIGMGCGFEDSRDQNGAISNAQDFSHFGGAMAEFIGYNADLNGAQRQVVENYLAAKYGLSLSAGDRFQYDGNGSPASTDYFRDLAGIGALSSNAFHTDAQSGGAIPLRLTQPSDLDPNEFAFWGNDDETQTTDFRSDIPTGIDNRLPWVWRFDETGDLGTVDVSFDLSGLNNPINGSDLVLLIDGTDATFASGATQVTVGRSFSNDVVTFSGVDLSDGDHFTLGSSSASSPLPVELVAFEVRKQGSDAQLHWVTASELNNSHFDIERSLDGNTWRKRGAIAGYGTTAQPQEYFFTDALNDLPADQREVFYRLHQHDFDGSSEYSMIKRLAWSADEARRTSYKLNIFYHDRSRRITITGLQSGAFQMDMVDGQGRRIGQWQGRMDAAGDHQQRVPELPEGIYLVRVIQGQRVDTERIWIRQ